MKRVVIIGGGIAGMTAGIYLQQAGFQTEVYEKHKITGGQCTGWKKKGYTIDNCVHWLTGTKMDSSLNTIWKNIGVLGENISLISREFFYRSVHNGITVTFWKDIERTRQEMLDLSPNDANEINKFFDYTISAQVIDMPVEKPFDMMSLIDMMRLGKSMKGIMPLIKEYGKIDVEDLGKRFLHPAIRKAVTDYLPSYYSAHSLLISYATFTSGNGAIPKDGSIEMAKRVELRYRSLEGTVHTNKNVESVIIENKRATGIGLKDKTIIQADYVVCACDTSFTFSELLSSKYMPTKLKKMYKNKDNYPVFSGYQLAFAVEGVYPEIQGISYFDCKPINIAKKSINRLNISSYDYEPSFAPENKSVFQVNVEQTAEDYNYWNKLRSNKQKYHDVKKDIATSIMNRVIIQYPCLKDKIEVLDAWTPVTYNRYTNAYKGSYMSFGTTKGVNSQQCTSKIKGLDNVFIASQWLMPPGGLPVAAATGKFAAQHIIRKSDRGFGF